MLSLTSLKLGLKDLFEKRHDDLNLSKAGQFYEPALKEQREEIDALPPILTGGAPLAKELDDLDGVHDGLGAAIFYVTEVYFRLPNAAPATVEAARRVRAAFIPELGELSATYATEAERAIARKPLLSSMKTDLELFPLVGGGTLLDTATSFLAAGEQLHGMLSDRADATPGSRKEAAALRSATLGVIGRLRADLAREVSKNPALPRDLDQRVFGYFDTLEAMHISPAKGAKAKAGEPAGEVKPPAEDPPKDV